MPMMPAIHRPFGDPQKNYEADRYRNKPWRRWYGLSIWRKGIRPQQLAAQPLCERCQAEGRVELAVDVNHKVPHRGDWQRFITGPFESLCKRCHASVVQREERAALQHSERLRR